MQQTVAKDGSKNNFLIDGFPRNQDNLQGWNDEMGDKTNLQFVLFFECDEKVSNVDWCFQAVFNS